MTNNRREGSSGGAPGIGVGEPGDPCPSLSLSHVPAVAYQCHGTPLVPVAYRTNAAGQVDPQGECTAALTTMTDPTTQFVAFYQCHGTTIGEMGTLRRGDGGVTSGVPFVATFDERNITIAANRSRVEASSPCHTLHSFPPTVIGVGVRRLTPIECEKLQGFPPDWTLIPHRGKPAADGPRYKAIGNSMAVPVVRWIGERIAAVDAIQAFQSPEG